jgi:transposase InsO family protein
VYRTARLAPRTREFLVAESSHLGVAIAARNSGTSRRTVYRWRHRAPSFTDRVSRPHRSPRRTAPEVEAAVLGLRLELRWGPDRLAAQLGLPVSTTHQILRRFRMHRLRDIFPVPRPVRGRFVVHEPGYIGVDVKSLGRLDHGGGRQARHHSHWRGGIGLTHLHVAIDLASRLVYAELRGGLGKADTVVFLRNALAFFDAHGIRVRRVLSDNGPGYKRTFALACAELGLRHRHIQPYHPWTNGRAEAFIGTIQRECTKARFFRSNDERALAVWLFVAYYNAERPHLGLAGLPPLEWLRRRGVTHVYGDFN